MSALGAEDVYWDYMDRDGNFGVRSKKGYFLYLTSKGRKHEYIYSRVRDHLIISSFV